MGAATSFTEPEPSRTDIDALRGATVLEFGTGWCGFCLGAQPLIAAAFKGHGTVRHLKVEDGAGKPLGRSFRVKLWPTLVFLKDGHELARLVRPANQKVIDEALALLDPAG